MASLIPGYEYDIFISYRQKDNKHDGWVTEFVNQLKGELESTFKEDISVYFDINPHDGLLETHDVDASLKDKLKCLVFIPIISRTYCDPKSFAWEHEFKAFVELAAQDKYELKVKLPGGNVASRVLPVRIYDLNKEDINLCESVLGGALRGIEFIYKSAGVNRPLRANEDHAQDNINKTYYRDQINKMSHSILEIFQGLRTEQAVVILEEKVPYPAFRNDAKELKQRVTGEKLKKSWMKVLYGIIIIVIMITSVISYSKIFKRDDVGDLRSEEILDKAIASSDVVGSWNDFSGKIRLVFAQSGGKFYSDQIVEIQTKENFYKCTSIYLNKIRMIEGVKNGKVFKEILDSSDVWDDLSKQLNKWDTFWLKQHHYCIFGLLMELKSSGLVLDHKANVVKFNGSYCFALHFTNDTARVKNDYFKESDWVVYIDPGNYSIKGFKTANYFAVYFGGFMDLGVLKIPMGRIFYNDSDSTFFAVDLITLP